MSIKAGAAKTIDPEHYRRDPVWGPVSYPARDRIEPGAPPWKDHIYLAFWDPTSRVYGFLHWNSSPNHATTKAQINLAIGDASFDVREPLPAAQYRFTSQSMDFDLQSAIRIDHPQLHAELSLTPKYVPIDFGA